jgi:hypothetical protein
VLSVGGIVLSVGGIVLSVPHEYVAESFDTPRGVLINCVTHHVL